MNESHKRRPRANVFSALLPAILCALPAAIGAPAAGGDFELTAGVIAGGGGRLAGAGFELVGTVSQPEADPDLSKGGSFALSGGFWSSAVLDAALFTDGFEG